MMGIGSPVGTLVSDVNRSDDLKQLQPEPSQCNGGVMGGVSLNDLGDILTEFLQIQDGHELASNNLLSQSSDKTGNIIVLKEDGCEENQIKSTILTSGKCFANCVTSPRFNDTVSVDGEYEKGNDLTAVLLKQNDCEPSKPAHALPIPTPLKLVSAMKGSREKWGTPPKKLTVSWAPDVYDPPPSAPTTVRINKPRSKSESKKNGKSKLKGKSSKGASSKDKRQVRKHGGSSNKCYRLLDDFDKLVDYNEPPMELGDFDVGSPDSYFGSSFL
ncbi:Leucine-rich repeat-containing protein [Actinidia chinensis var. chinensis]|uniref:Leucine-rich repeat-containing protein n=1 Tax=Actinidia chinensis var. chinensis TaxID=1590841 RepID=A0A2R6QKF8_ACTCC|nr:Leucine-rich repeat-containing protein [Actinidia chinensis var. chinensis]